MSAETHYRAFISYSHADKLFARRLHRKLETYRVPARLVGRDGAQGPIPERLTPIFRDEDELPASGDLSGEIKAALAASASLIVLCSPDAAQSQWVEREIELFRQIHGEKKPVFAAIVSGDPKKVMPQALLAGSEPIAADFRESEDGANLALMKLVAGLSGASLADLVQRDAQRRIRRVMAITTGALIGVIAMGALATLAIRSRSEAQRQRAEAEGLIEYMLTDLRGKLKGVGRTDVMAAVNSRAMAYYDNSSLEDLPPESLEKRSRIIHAMGEDDNTLGRSSEAQAKFVAAHRTTAAILAQQPNNPDAIFAHAQSEYWVGKAALQRRDYVSARAHWKGYLEQANHLVDVEPNMPRGLLEKGYAHGNLCELSFNQNYDRKDRLNEAEQECRASISSEVAARNLAPSDKEITMALANRYGWLANVLSYQQKYDDALRQRDAEAELVAQLIQSDRRNVELQIRQLFVTRGRINIYFAQNQNDQAADAARDLLTKYEALLREVGNRTDLLEMKVNLLVHLARFQRGRGKVEWAKTALEAEQANKALAAITDNKKLVVAYNALINELKRGKK